ncbi:MAG: hypothetical protein WB723_00550, partial [Candidatus Acidiferrales bacterium]
TMQATVNDGDTQKHLLEVIQGDKELASTLSKAIAAVAKDTNFRDEKITERLRMLLISPDAESIVRQMYGLWLIPDARPSAEPQLRREFLALLSHHEKL